MRLVPVFILETHNQTNNECLPKFVQTDNASSTIKTANHDGELLRRGSFLFPVSFLSLQLLVVCRNDLLLEGKTTEHLLGGRV